MAVNVKMGVDIGGFTAGIKQGQQILKGLNAEMKASEAEFKATGNAEQKLSSQTKTLNSQLNVQKGIADSARQALKSMTDAGVNPADAAYQKLYVTMLNAEAGANEAQAALNALAGGTEQAAQGADQLTNSLSGISKKMSLAQVADGIDKITGGLEKAAQKAIQFGEQLWNVIMDSARRADDTQTMAEMYGIDLQKFKQMQALVQNGLDTSVDSMLGAQDKLKKGIGKGSEEVMTALEEMGLAFSSGKDGAAQLITDDTVELFWKAGQALMQMDEAFDKEATAQTLFGKSWKELIPLFSTYKTIEEYEDALSKTSVSSEEATKNAAELNDRVSQLEGTWTQLKDEVIGAVAGPLAKAAETLEGLLARVLEYLKTEKGQQALKDLETAVTGLFDNLSEIDPAEVVEGFTGVFNSIITGLEWLVENKDTVIGALKAIVIGWAGLKLTGGALDLLNLVNGLTGLGNGKINPQLPTDVPKGSPTTPSAPSGGNDGTGVTGGGVGLWASIKSGFATFAPFLLEEAGVMAVALTPAILAQVANENKWKEEQNSRLKAAEEAGQFADLIRSGALAVGPKRNADGSYQTNMLGFLDNNPTSNPAAFLMSMSAYNNQQQAQLMNAIRMYNPYTNGYYTNELLTEYWKNPNSEKFTDEMMTSMVQNITDALAEYEKQDHLPQMPVELTPEEGTVENILESIGTIVIPAKIKVEGMAGGGSGRFFAVKGHANGLPYVPYDGYLASLHKGERVVPAREVSSRNYSSNLYVESMYMNGGTDAAGLAAAMAAAQRRTMSGYGS